MSAPPQSVWLTRGMMACRLEGQLVGRDPSGDGGTGWATKWVSLPFENTRSSSNGSGYWVTQGGGNVVPKCAPPGYGPVLRTELDPDRT